jgi:hypothetical protein
MAPRHSRSLSYTEISTALTCQALWDFRYGGTLAGSTLKPKLTKAILSEGRAWGAMVAAWHGDSGSLMAEMNAAAAMRRSLASDFERMEALGVKMNGLHDQQMEMEYKLSRIFEDYRRKESPMRNLTKIEDEIDVPLPGRSGGRRASSLYRFQCFLDGFIPAGDAGNEWLVEYKLRGRLTPHEMLQLGRQYLWYAWARQRQTGRSVVGLVVDERLNGFPSAPKLKKAPKGTGRDGYTVSHDAQKQTCTEKEYLDACELYRAEPSPAVVEALRSRVWQQRYAIPFVPSELEEAGRELVSAAMTIRDLDAGRYPVRNAQMRLCNGCDFKRVCKNPTDVLFVDLLFERTVPKRLRRPEGDEPLTAGSEVMF